MTIMMRIMMVVIMIMIMIVMMKSNGEGDDRAQMIMKIARHHHVFLI